MSDVSSFYFNVARQAFSACREERIKRHDATPDDFKTFDDLPHLERNALAKFARAAFNLGQERNAEYFLKLAQLNQTQTATKIILGSSGE